MDVRRVDHVNLRIPRDRVDEFASLYRDHLGFDLEHLADFRDGDRDFFFLRLNEGTVVHVSPTDAFSPPDGDGYGHLALFVEESQATIRERLRESAAEIVADVDGRLGATGTGPSIYAEDPFGYVVEFKSPS